MPSALDIASKHEEIVKLYLDDGYSAKVVAERLTASGFPICQITLLRYLKKCGLVKKRGTPGFCAKGRCAHCGDEFMRTNPRHKWCSKCLPDQSVRYRLTRFKLSQLKFDAELRKQEHCCAICRRSFDECRIYVDHDHKTGQYRGLLCNRCNVALGYIEIEGMLDSSLAYLQRNGAV